MVKPRRKKIAWTVEEVARRSTPKLARMPYVEEQDTSTEDDRAHLEIGSMWYITRELARDDSYHSTMYEQHPYPYLTLARGWMWRSPNIRYENAGMPGTPAIYLGTVRVEERDPRTTRLLSIPRHSFMVSGMRWLTRTLDYFTWKPPVES
jgi:hypothetical protein